MVCGESVDFLSENVKSKGAEYWNGGKWGWGWGFGLGKNGLEWWVLGNTKGVVMRMIEVGRRRGTIFGVGVGLLILKTIGFGDQKYKKLLLSSS